MKLITIHDSASRIIQIDALVEQKEFTSRAEVYRTGAFVLLTHKKARDLAKNAQLDPSIFEKHIKNCFTGIKNKNNGMLLDELRFIINGLTFRELTSLLQNEEDDRITFETMREGLQNYEKTLMVFDKLEPKLQQAFYMQLENDVRVLDEYIKEKLNLIQIETYANNFREYFTGQSAGVVNWNTLSAAVGNTSLAMQSLSRKKIKSYSQFGDLSSEDIQEWR